MNELLYKIQLQIKKDDECQQRQLDETKRIKTDFMSQIQNYVITLYNFVLAMNFGVKDNEQPFNPLKKNSIQLSEDQNLSEFVDYLSSNFLDVLDACFGAETSLPKEAIELILTNFHYFWADEYCQKFYQTIVKSNQNIRAKLCRVLTFQPNTMIYFVSVLSKVFDSIDDDINTYDLINIFTEYAVKLAPMLPLFVRKCLLLMDDPHVIYFQIMEPILNNFEYFGIAHPEIRQYDLETIENLIEEIKDYFNRDSTESFIHKIIDKEEYYSSQPQEIKIIDVISEYKQFTLVTPGIFSINYPNFKFASKPPQIPVFVNSNTKIERDPPPEFQLDETYEAIIQFLLHAQLNRVSSVDGDNPMNYFQSLCDLSSVYGDPDLEDDLDKLMRLVQFDSLKELLEKLENYYQAKMQHIQFNPLKVITQYSLQNRYIQRLLDFVAKIENRKIEAIEYNSMLSKLKNIDDLAVHDKNGDFSESFCEVFTKISNQLGATSLSELRAVFNTIGIKNRIFTKMGNSLIEKDSRFRFCICHFSTEIINTQSADFMEQFKNDPSKFEVFVEEISVATRSVSPLEACSHISNCIQLLCSLLESVGLKEIGADQITPIFIVAICIAHPSGLIILSEIMFKCIVPLFTIKSPLDRQIEYSCVQFVSAVKCINEFLASKQ
ncbi:hypothetical protein TVAG_097980 [Trichomonas vaginalis G3]|uniref:VPS9 domain-containing protein n=1 Tax=Trichomonas vaginalis (strain ATCC PRA-98 / G3) TaxID=412133 RepID=A2E2C8_TRIV3|nr:VPS9 domain family [Trichomonas vaginalis G3]EAY13228.1 hypothetical protein TVAG_097980 [Trichomonas vaginalis G3]KAI5488140.1 VPS9 domain family [Trichomonas vaginalis G3]|eukprot:XP_001325451.1 hypothetical protein [Trichomonas vaginalis G3]